MISKQQQRHNIRNWNPSLCKITSKQKRRKARKARKIAEVEWALDGYRKPAWRSLDAIEKDLSMISF